MADIYDKISGMIHPLYNYSVWEPNPPISDDVSERARRTAQIAMQSDEYGQHETLTEDQFWQLFLINNTAHFDGLPKIFFDAISVIEHPQKRGNIAFHIGVAKNRVLHNQERPHNCGQIESYGEGWKPLLNAVLNGSKLGYSLSQGIGQFTFVNTDYYLTKLSLTELDHKNKNDWWNMDHDRIYPIPDVEPHFRGQSFTLPNVTPSFDFESQDEKKQVKFCHKSNSICKPCFTIGVNVCVSIGL